MEFQRSESSPLHRRAVRKGGQSENSYAALLRRKQEKTIEEVPKTDIEDIKTPEIIDDVE